VAPDRLFLKAGASPIKPFAKRPHGRNITMTSSSFQRGACRGPLRRPASLFLAGVVAGLLCLAGAAPPDAPPPEAPSSSSDAAVPTTDCFQIDDFEDYQTGDAPSEWRRNKDRELVPADREVMEKDSHEAIIQSEGGCHFVRMKMHNYAYRLIKLSGKHFPKWNTSACPMLAWEWRVNDYPEGADETDDDNNDVAAAVYVTFGRDWLGRPKSIKYTYSSTQPVGTTADYGSLKVLVVASVKDGSPTGEWMSMKRNVVRDYKTLFGEAPDDDTPVGIQLFSDADTGSERTAVADFDDVRVAKE
jgi:hypothetical protein